MAPRRTDPTRMALILVHALYSTDKAAAREYGVSERTIENYRKRLGTDVELTEIFILKKAEVEQDWVARIGPAIFSSVDYLEQAAKEISKTDPDAVHAVAGALKILAEISMTREIMNARLTRYIDESRTKDKSLVAGHGNDPANTIIDSPPG